MPAIERKRIVSQILLISLFLVLILFEFSSLWRTANSLLDQRGPENVSLQIEYLIDHNRITPQQISQQNFAPLAKNEHPKNFGKSNVWYRITLSNLSSDSQSLVLMMDNPMSDYIDLYKLRMGRSIQLEQNLGDKAPMLSRALHSLPHYRFSLEPREQTTYLLNYRSDAKLFLPLVVMTEANFQRYQNMLHMIWGAFIGIVMIMAAYNLVLYIGYPDQAYLSYVGYIGCMLVLLGVVHGYGYYIFPDFVQMWLAENIIVLNSIAAYYALTFAMHFLKVNKNNDSFYDSALHMRYFLLAYAVFAYFTPEYLSAMLFGIVQLLSYAIVLRMVLNKLKQRFNWSKYYLLSWIPFFIGAFIAFELISGNVPYNFFTRHALLFAVIFEMGLISMALANRLGEKERERLYQATHDFRLSLANEVLLEQAIAEYSKTHIDVELSLISVEIANYDAVIPYVDADHLQLLMHGMASSFGEQLSEQLELICIDPKSVEQPNCALIRGDLFAFLVRTKNVDELQRNLQRISNQENFNPLQNIIPYRIHCLFGAAVYSTSQNDPATLINSTKKAINLACQKGLPYYIYNPVTTNNSDRKVRLAQDLVNAIHSNQLQLFHQPQLDLKKPTVASSEVLLRWQHPDYGCISPVEFINIAEETGLIRAVTRWVLNKAFAQTKKLIRDAHCLHNTSINISASDLSRPDFYDEVMFLLSKHQVQARYFTLEITETAHLSDKHFFESNLKKLKNEGFRFAIDDFGTGYSSLSYANEHPFSELKIDRTFVHSMLSSRKQMTIVSATVSMAKELGLSVTAEGVEDIDVFNALKKMGCDKIQGLYVAPPMSLSEYKHWGFSTDKQDKHYENVTNIQLQREFKTAKSTV